jgi:hypothetical protein
LPALLFRLRTTLGKHVVKIFSLPAPERKPELCRHDSNKHVAGRWQNIFWWATAFPTILVASIFRGLI